MSIRDELKTNVYCPVCGRFAKLDEEDVVRCIEGHEVKIEVKEEPAVQAESWMGRSRLF